MSSATNPDAATTPMTPATPRAAGIRRLTAVTAGLAQPSSSRLLADRLVAATQEALRQRGMQPQVQVVELRDHGQDVMNALLTRVPTGQLKEIVDEVERADGLIAVSPVFNASYNGLFKAFFDILEPESLAGTPVLVGATGGTPRHSLVLEHAMRPLFAYLRSVVAPTAVYAASEDWGSGRSRPTNLAQRIEQAAAEFAALVAERPRAQRPDPYAEPTPFNQLLSG